MDYVMRELNAVKESVAMLWKALKAISPPDARPLTSTDTLAPPSSNPSTSIQQPMPSPSSPSTPQSTLHSTEPTAPPPSEPGSPASQDPNPPASPPKTTASPPKTPASPLAKGSSEMSLTPNMAKLVQSEDLLNFIHMAEAALPQAIDDLTLNPGSSACLAKVAGLLVGAMVATTGHRKCVFLGMTTDDIMNAQPYKKSFTIRVSISAL
ncbi:hypothetical protein AALO_G00284410 [Alosa alosa]|uniref:Uncharacterized protein n=1 Tax=Alosa alosa TaxID=278164 RepID=A0AAV6FK90_9TELE|nr:hypothetical protein AALO_G00284410 [Alosa alosa]